MPIKGTRTEKTHVVADLILGQGAMATQSVMVPAKIGLSIAPGAAPLTQLTVSYEALTINAGITLSSSMVLSQTNTLTIDSAVVGAGGSLLGSLGASQFYGVYVIYNPATNTIAGFMVPVNYLGWTFPTGYTHNTPTGYVLTDASSHLVAQYQFQNEVFYAAQAPISLGSNPSSFASLDLSSVIPVDATVVMFQSQAAGGGNTITFSMDGAKAVAAVTNSGIPIRVPLAPLPAASQSIYYKTSTSGMTLYVNGYCLNF